MSGGIQFTRGNPAIGAQQRGNQERDRQRSSLITAEAGAQRNAMDAATAPDEVRRTRARTSKAEDDARFSRATLGNRITASNVANTNAELQGFYESLKFLDQGDVESARFVAERYGQQIPEPVFQNRALQRQLSVIADQAQTQYPNNPRKQQEYIQNAVQGLQDETAGAGRATDPFFPYSVPGAPEADEFAPSRSGGGSGGTTIYHTRYDLFRRNGFSELEADAFASGRRQPSAQDVVKIADARTRDQVRAMPPWDQPSAEEMQAMREENLNRVQQDLRSAGFDFDIPQSRTGDGAQGPQFDGPRVFTEEPGNMPSGLNSRLRSIGQDMLPDVAPITATQQAPRQAPQQPAPSNDQEPPVMNTPEEAEQLPPGTIFRTPDGRTLIR